MAERISDAEHAVMEVLWSKAPVSAQDVATDCAKTHGWTLPTVKTLLSRLVTKGAVSTKADGRKFLYSPLIERSDYVTGESGRLLKRLFGGRLSPLVAHFAEREKLTANDIEEIEELLKALKS
jgi:BlaI family transcriptional regulator, penicillinase repressor